MSFYKEFQMPKRVDFDRESLTDTYGKLIIEPLERGYGITLGNSLRRILLSSIEGAAIYAIRINGVLHEISSIPGVKEDVIDIILNVKKIRIKYLTQETDSKIASIKIKGPCDVYAKDITTDGTYEILNKDQYICSLDQDTELEMYFYLRKGRGYIPSEIIKDEGLPLDAISVDAIFSPIKKVNFRIEKTRVGELTDYDKLVLELWTDGSITPEKAISEASDIMIKHLEMLKFTASNDNLGEKKDVEDDEGKSFIYDKLNENVLKPIEDLELSVRAYNCLKSAGINLIAELIQKSEGELLKTKNFGRRSLEEIKEVLNRQGLRLEMRLEPGLLEKLNEKFQRG